MCIFSEGSKLLCGGLCGYYSDGWWTLWLLWVTTMMGGRMVAMGYCKSVSPTACRGRRFLFFFCFSTFLHGDCGKFRFPSPPPGGAAPPHDPLPPLVYTLLEDSLDVSLRSENLALVFFSHPRRILASFVRRQGRRKAVRARMMMSGRMRVRVKVGGR